MMDNPASAASQERVIAELRIALESLQRENKELTAARDRSVQHETDLLSMLDMLDGMAWSVDDRLQIRTMNDPLRKRMHDLHGVEPRIGDMVLDVMHDLDQAAKERWRANYAKALQGEKLSFLYELSMPESTSHIAYSFNPVSVGGQVVGVSCFAQDLTEQVGTVQALKASEQRFRALVENSYDLLTIRDENGEVLYESPAKHRILGYALDEPNVPQGYEVVLPADREATRAAFAQALSAPGVPIAHRGRLVRKDGSIIHVEGHMTNLLHVPEVGGVVSNIRDITALVEATEDLRASEALMVEAQRVGHTGSWEHSLERPDDPMQAIARWSDEMYRILGHAPGGITASFGNFLDAVHPEDRNWVEADVLRAIRTGEPCSIHHRILRADGTVRWLHQEALIVADPADRYRRRMVGTMQDITDRKSAEQQLRSSEERFRAMIEGSADGISLSDAATNILYSSPSALRILGYTPEEMLGLHGADLVVEEHRAALMRVFLWVVERPGSSERVQLRMRHKNGEPLWVDALLTNMLHVPAVQAMVTNYRDITEAKALQDQVTFDRNNLNALINSTEDLVWSVDRDYRIIAVNNAAVNTFEHAIGFRIKPGDHLRVPDVAGASATSVWYGYFERALAGETFQVEEHALLPHDTYTALNYAPIRDQGAVVGVAVFARDVTEIRRTQGMLERTHLEVRASELQKASILDALPARVVLLDRLGTIKAVNGSWRAFWGQSEFPWKDHGVGIDYLAIARRSMGHGDSHYEHMSKGISSVLQGAAQHFKMEYGLPTDAPKRWFQLRAAPLSGQDGAVVMQTDVTELRLAREELQRWNTHLEDRVVERTTELILVNEELEAETEKNKRLGREVAARAKELMASISYASNIQRSLIPERRKFDFFKDMGLVFRPRDVVSGDFIWCHGTDAHFIVAVADCTGHGVPGAMMSMLGHDLLNNIVLLNGRSGPQRILDELDAGVGRLFLRAEGLNRTDGMDVAVVTVDKATLQMTFSGAGLPVLILREGGPILLPGTKATIGGHHLPGAKVFQEHTCQLHPGDRICLFTDGYSDQFGGPRKKKFYRRDLFKLLDSLYAPGPTGTLGAEQAALALVARFVEWKGAEDQVDDVLVLLLDV